MRRIVSLILVVCIFAVCFGGCGSSEKKVVGKWYNDRGKCLDIRSDGSWKLEGSYGTGTWKMLDDGTFEFTDFYGDTQESPIITGASGDYIDFGYYGDFYRDGYPQKEDQKQTEPGGPVGTEAPETTPTAEPTTAPTEPPAVPIDPFEGLSFEVTGVSPYCKVAINNSKCSKDAQLFVTYELDKEYYENGETAVVTASLGDADDETYVLSTTEATYTISDMPEYITSLEGIDLSVLEAELDDYVDANSNKAIGDLWLFGVKVSGNHYNTINDIQEKGRYFSAVKKIKERGDIDFYNSLSTIFAVSARNDAYEDDVDVYVIVTAYNIIKWPDGTIKWGKTDPDSYGFEYVGSNNSVEYLVSTQISVLSSDYNIEKVETESTLDESTGID